MLKIRNFITLTALLFLLAACGSDSKREIFGPWETTTEAGTHYLVFEEGSVSALFLSNKFDCYVKNTFDVSYPTATTIVTSQGSTEYKIQGDQLTLGTDTDTDEPITYQASSIDLNTIKYCEDPSVTGDIEVTVEFEDFAETLRAESADLEIDYTYYIDVIFDMDNDGSRSVGDIEFGVYYGYDFHEIPNPTLSQLSWNISTVTKMEDSTTYYETIAYPEFTLDAENQTITLKVARGTFPAFTNISLSSNIGIKARSAFYTEGSSLTDTFPEVGYIDISNLSSSVDAINDAFGTAEDVNLIDIKSISVTITE